jgi:Zn-finger nucleic acid-binding protein
MDKRVGAACPRCKDLKLQPFGIGPATLHGCPRCRGSFLPASEWDALLDTAETSGLPREAGTVVPPLPGLGPSPAALREHIACPTCAETMEQVEFGTAGLLVIDVCKLHGIWLDGGELVGAIESVRAGRLAFREAESAPSRDAAPSPGPSHATASAVDLAGDVAGVAGTIAADVGAAAASTALEVLVDIVASIIIG